MATIQERIEQWEQMAEAAPDDMAFFSLGNAYREAERYEDAAGAYTRAIELNNGMSRAYQFLGQCLIKLDRNDSAADFLAQGYKIAAQRGDVMPQKAIGSLLTEKLGKDLPDIVDIEKQREEIAASGDTVLDRRSGTAQPKLPDPPMRGPMGEFIFQNFGQDTWREWIQQGTKVINELRLDFSDTNQQDVYEKYMLEWLGVSEEEADEIRKS
ncbi:oxidative damage protection protein [Poriferisphaera corsica]|uniref:Oxidative damage protection protein n=1 Tax=Poriferisphaera corsica TaxID=2528020 RepID=A0A517YQE4_9BACT|nr:Fe(2+)-trafficking protein [Poriferisphaera corsica]QDU32438.1 oxidative damage protection protein [Poriferisphaera corsica]